MTDNRQATPQSDSPGCCAKGSFDERFLFDIFIVVEGLLTRAYFYFFDGINTLGY